MRLVAVALLAAAAAAAAPPATPPPRDDPSSRYLSALRTANGFLAAWATRDGAAGIRLVCEELTGRGRVLRRSRDRARLVRYFAGPPSPRHQAYEIGRGFAVRATGEIEFPVMLFELHDDWLRSIAYASEIRVAEREGTWCVRQLPVTSDLAALPRRKRGAAPAPSAADRLIRGEPAETR